MKRKYVRPDKRAIVKKVLDNKTDYEEAILLEGSSKQDYALNARLILESKVWKNEIKRLCDIWIKTAAADATSYGEILDMRACVAALKTFESRLEAIASWAHTKKPEAFDQHAEI